MAEEQEARLTAAGNEMSASFLAARKRSEETLKKLEENPGKFTMLTGDRPTGRLHLGHFFGSIKERVAMQNRGVNTNIIIADYQVITDRDTTEHIDDNVLNLVLDYMAAGIDPEKTMIFTHSAIPAENQLMLPFLSLVTEAELHRNPTVKSEMESSGHALTGLLLTYPVHQACDILFCKANVVPIGKDNLPHVEITRTIARRFNERYAKKHPIFPEPAAILSDAPEIPGLDGRKMSKSYGNSIMLGVTAEETAKLIKKSPTDSERMITFDPEHRPQVAALLTTAGLVTDRDPKEIAEELGNAGAGALKQYVTESVNEFLAPHRERRAELAQDMDTIRDILHEGNRRANAIANETLDEVREAMGMRYDR
ncbi:tryptophanyl-tRNA synthetase [Bifidobacterium italicum]|uniref:Tryptophan--tRNA ligase n=1 Tax=Bifidobacterium italicum TaxID=1960968 RepID=A0A2A2ELJ8_9BIFI|nr:tryptophan--tRNA ligase [Bifidobacterium italicum]PAU69862.1 tryptophanyl-tRNA synthetase [Bifidobacterium italicum]